MPESPAQRRRRRKVAQIAALRRWAKMDPADRKAHMAAANSANATRWELLAGLRRSEVLSLRAGDLTRNGTVYYAVRTKGGHDRRRELPAPAFHAIEQALTATDRRIDQMDPSERLFPISSHGFYANLRRYAMRAGLEGVTPHVLRHSAAKLRREAGASIEDVQSLLGHRSLATTATYLRRLEGEGDSGWAPVAAALGLQPA